MVWTASRSGAGRLARLHGRSCSPAWAWPSHVISRSATSTPGAPELRSDSRYNRDVAYVNAAGARASSDVLAVMVQTADGRCSQYDTLNKIDALEWQLRQLDGVESTNMLALSNGVCSRA